MRCAVCVKITKNKLSNFLILGYRSMNQPPLKKLLRRLHRDPEKIKVKPI
mgnify:CR=1 FL=1